MKSKLHFPLAAISILLSDPSRPLAAEPALGAYHLVSAHTDVFRWYDSLVADTSGRWPAWAVLNLKSFNLENSGASLCIEGIHEYSDYGGTDFNYCRRGSVAVWSSIERIHAIRTDSLRLRGALPVLRLAGPAMDSMLFAYTATQDTLSLSTYWISGALAGPMFIPGDWKATSVNKLCSLYIASDSRFRTWTSVDWQRSLESLTITRHTLKLIPGPPTSITPSSATRSRPAPASPSDPDALGRRIDAASSRPRPGLHLAPR